jgi:uncharacterized protein
MSPVRSLLCILLLLAICTSTLAQKASFRVLAFYSPHAEYDHVVFAEQAIQFFQDAARRDHFDFETTTNWDVLTSESLKQYQVVLWLNDSPHSEAQRASFQQYMSHGGGWLGFHASAYNDESTHWPWFVDFLGGAIFYGNNWPPLPAKLTIDDPTHAVTKGVPASFLSPANEWYIWKPDPRMSKDVKVLLTLDPANYPLGLKDTLKGGDLPVVWTNTRYRMIYMNMGHGDRIFTDQTQNRLFENAVLWLGQRNGKSD